MQSFRRLDVFQKANQDIDSSSSIGGIFSILAFIVGLILFVNEYLEWSTYKNVKKLEIQSLQSAQVKVTLDITVFGAPCYLLSLDIADEVGNHISDYTDTMEKIRLDSQNKLIQNSIESNMTPYQGTEKEIQYIIKQIKSKEQCRFKGHLFLKSIPGNFHISFHSKMELLNTIHKHDIEAFKMINVNHQINKLFFGNPLPTFPLEKLVGREMQDQDAFDETRYNYEGKNDYDNYVKILPLSIQGVKDVDIEKQRTFRYTMYQSVVARSEEQIPVIYFRYEVSPINIIYSRRRKSVYNFIVQISAILGGIFSVMGILNSLATNVISSIKSK